MTWPEWMFLIIAVVAAVAFVGRSFSYVMGWRAKRRKKEEPPA